MRYLKTYNESNYDIPTDVFQEKMEEIRDTLNDIVLDLKDLGFEVNIRLLNRDSGGNIMTRMWGGICRVIVTLEHTSKEAYQNEETTNALHHLITFLEGNGFKTKHDPIVPHGNMLDPSSFGKIIMFVRNNKWTI